MTPVEATVFFHMLRLHTPNGQDIDVNPTAVVTIREPQVSEHFPKGTKCVVNMSDGKFNLVVEECSIVRAQIEEIRK